MKTNLKLNALAAKSLSEVEMNQVKGGRSVTVLVRYCGCACAYVNQGSSTNANCNANYGGGARGLNSPDNDFQCVKEGYITIEIADSE
jgi:natural product precursor